MTTATPRKETLHANAAGLAIDANRKARKWSRREQAMRALWMGGAFVFALTPRPLWGMRRALLRVFGARVGADARLHPSVRIAIPFTLTIGARVGVGERATLYALGPMVIGDDATVSQGAHLCGGTHDHRDPAMTLIKAPLTVEAGAWVCADAFIGPGVTVGRLAVVGARAVAMRDVPPHAIVAGNPAKVVGTRTLRANP